MREIRGIINGGTVRQNSLQVGAIVQDGIIIDRCRDEI